LNAVVAWVLFFLHVLFMYLLMKPYAHGPRKEETVASIPALAAIIIPFLAVPIAWYVSCDVCGKPDEE
jgi:cytochrome bd-type quinol oxidase subunit 1